MSEVVDIEDGGAESPFDAPQAFFDPSDEPRHLQRRNNNRNDRRPQRGGDQRRDNRPDNRQDNRGEHRNDNRHDNRGGHPRDQRQGGQHRQGGHLQGPRPQGGHAQHPRPQHGHRTHPTQQPVNKPTEVEGEIVEGEEIIGVQPQLEGGPMNPDQQTEGEGGGRRRRRRRGRRGRGGKGGQGGLPQSQNITEGDVDSAEGHIDDDGPQPVIKSQPYLGAPVDEVEEIAPYDDPETDLPAPGNELSRVERPVEPKDKNPSPRTAWPRVVAGVIAKVVNHAADNHAKAAQWTGGQRAGGRGPQHRAPHAPNAGAPHRTPPRHVRDDVDALPAPSEPTPPPIPQPPVVKTGSTDRHHLHTDTPIDPQPISRPRSYRDMDVIPG